MRAGSAGKYFLIKYILYNFRKKEFFGVLLRYNR